MLFAGLNALGRTTVIESEASRDHTEKMLRHFGAEDARPSRSASTAARSRWRGGPNCTPRPIVVPVDPVLRRLPDRGGAAGARAPTSCVEGVMMNPLRIGLLTTLLEMGARIDILERREEGGEEVADLRVRATRAARRRCAGGARALR